MNKCLQLANGFGNITQQSQIGPRVLHLQTGAGAATTVTAAAAAAAGITDFRTGEQSVYWGGGAICNSGCQRKIYTAVLC